MYNYNYPSASNPQTPQQQNSQPGHTYVYPLQNNQQYQEIKPIQYPTLNQDKESISIDNPQNEQVISNDYLQQQYQIQNPPIQPQPPQPLNQPLIQQNYPIIYADEVVELTLEQRRKLIGKINGWWMLQQCLQIFLSIINMISYSYDNLFYDLREHRYRITVYVFLVITFTFLLIVRFGIPLQKTRGNQFIYFATYCVLYSFLVSGVVSAGHASWDSNSGIYFFFGFLYFLGSIGSLIMLIQFHFQIKSFKEEEMKLSEFLKSVLYGPIAILLIMTVLFGADLGSIIMVYLIIYQSVFTLFYISSLLQIYKGKFKLRQDQFFIGSVLAYVNMLFLCI